MIQKLTKPPYKGATNQWLTEALFWERSQNRTNSTRVYEPVFTLYEDRPGLINCRTTFVALKDPTGRKWAMLYLKDWFHWQRLMGCSWFKEAYEFWCEELDQMLKSEAVAKMYELLNSENPAQALQAAKFLASHDYRENKTKRGRPSNEEVRGALKQAVEAKTQEDEDLLRLGLSLPKQGVSLAH